MRGKCSQCQRPAPGSYGEPFFGSLRSVLYSEPVRSSISSLAVYLTFSLLSATGRGAFFASLLRLGVATFGAGKMPALGFLAAIVAGEGARPRRSVFVDRGVGVVVAPVEPVIFEGGDSIEALSL
jgi:hypothetical protein